MFSSGRVSHNYKNNLTRKKNSYILNLIKIKSTTKEERDLHKPVKNSRSLSKTIGTEKKLDSRHRNRT
jgi:hypothetical protein